MRDSSLFSVGGGQREALLLFVLPLPPPLKRWGRARERTHRSAREDWAQIPIKGFEPNPPGASYVSLPYSGGQPRTPWTPLDKGYKLKADQSTGTEASS